MVFLSRANRDRDDLVVAGRVELRRSVADVAAAADAASRSAMSSES